MQGEDTLPRAVEARWYGAPYRGPTDEREIQRLYGDPQHDPDPSSGPEALFRPWSPNDSDEFDGSDDSDDELRASTNAPTTTIRFRGPADD